MTKIKSRSDIDFTCKDAVQGAFDGRMEDIRKLYKAKNNETEELGNLSEYGLCMDYVIAGTFAKQRAGYKRYQISYGGPSEEFRIYDNGDVEFWYLDWFDGACVDVTGDDAEIIKDLTSHIEAE